MEEYLASCRRTGQPIRRAGRLKGSCVMRVYLTRIKTKTKN